MSEAFDTEAELPEEEMAEEQPRGLRPRRGDQQPEPRLRPG
ncbi:hypothetical protein [Phenylobacterium sp. J367]|nr:hypothetical protein [Phenylobacterium sp. J367]